MFKLRNIVSLFFKVSVTYYLLVSTLTTRVTAAAPTQEGLIDVDGYFEKVLEEWDLEEKQFLQATKTGENDNDRSLLFIESDGSVGSKCNFLTRCNTGLDCFHNRCIPKRDCLKERLQEFNDNFDAAGYKNAMFQETGVTEEDIVSSWRESGGDDVVFVQSPTMQSLIHYRQKNNEPFEPLLEIVDACAGRTRTRRSLNNNEESDDQDPNGPPLGWTFTTGLHLEGGLIFEASLTMGWTVANSYVHIRRCLGAGLQGGIELSLYAAITFDSSKQSWECGSILFDADAAFGVAFGIGLGICFVDSSAAYLEFTLGAGIGAGIGYSVCGASLPAGNSPTTAAPTPTPIPSISNAPSTAVPTVSSAPSVSSAPTGTVVINANLAYGFFSGTTLTEPTREEIDGLLVQTVLFYTDVLSQEYGSTFTLQIQENSNTWTPADAFPFLLDFDATVVSTASTDEVFAVMEGADYVSYIINYVWNSEPVGTTIFFDVQQVAFNAS